MPHVEDVVVVVEDVVVVVGMGGVVVLVGLTETQEAMRIHLVIEVPLRSLESDSGKGYERHSGGGYGGPHGGFRGGRHGGISNGDAEEVIVHGVLMNAAVAHAVGMNSSLRDQVV
ncbi:hypothetical protein Hdeb2414_s0007g00240881 [Helianthus debilis subsp. tardiflorus]